MKEFYLLADNKWGKPMIALHVKRTKKKSSYSNLWKLMYEAKEQSKKRKYSSGMCVSVEIGCGIFNQIAEQRTTNIRTEEVVVKCKWIKKFVPVNRI